MTPAQKEIKRWREDPVCFVRNVLKAQPDDWQIDILKAFPHKNRIAMQAAKGPGKTALLAWCAWNFICTRPYPKMAATSITADNLNDNLWPEMAKWQAKSEFLTRAFQWTKTRIYATDHAENWFMSARTWPKSADPTQQANTLAGLHADYLLFILDESGGIPDAVAATAEAGLATGKETKILQAGNPTHLEGPLYRAATSERHLWYLVEITGDPDSPKRASRISKQWAREQIETYGKDNPWVLVNVYGKFPPSSLNTLLGPNEVSDAMKRQYDEDKYSFTQKRLGVDVARFGDDRTVLFPRQGLRAFNPIEMRGARTNAIAARVALAKQKWKSQMEFVDDTGGYGAGVIDSMIQGGLSPVSVNFASKATDPRYINKRAEMWFNMAEWVKRGGQLPNIPELVKELTSPTYTFINGKFQLEEKKHIKERLGYSPDLADALCLTFAVVDMPAELALEGKLLLDGNKLKCDYDPFDPNRL